MKLLLISVVITMMSTHVLADKVELTINVVNNVVVLTWQAKKNKTYVVCRSSDLKNWEVISDNLLFESGRGSFKDDEAPLINRAFYRLVKGKKDCDDV